MKNLAIDVLTCVIQEQLDIANNVKAEKQVMDEEFTEEVLRGVFQEIKG